MCKWINETEREREREIHVALNKIEKQDIRTSLFTI